MAKNSNKGANGAGGSNGNTSGADRFQMLKTKKIVQVIVNDPLTERMAAEAIRLGRLIDDIDRSASRSGMTSVEHLQSRVKIAEWLDTMHNELNALRADIPRSARNNRGRKRRGGTASAVNGTKTNGTEHKKSSVKADAPVPPAQESGASMEGKED